MRGLQTSLTALLGKKLSEAAGSEGEAHNKQAQTHRMTVTKKFLTKMIVRVAQQLFEYICDSGRPYECMEVIVQGDNKQEIFDYINDILEKLNSSNQGGAYTLSVSQCADDDEFEIMIEEKEADSTVYELDEEDETIIAENMENPFCSANCDNVSVEILIRCDKGNFCNEECLKKYTGK